MFTRGKTFASRAFLSALIILTTGCNQNGIDPLDPAYVGDYALKPDWSDIGKDSLMIFKEYLVPYSVGKDPFKLVTASTAPPGFLDTALFTQESQNGTLKLFFLNTGTCAITVDGLRPNDLHVVDTARSLAIMNPYRITGDTVVSVDETAGFRLAPVPELDESRLDLCVEWKLGDSTCLLGPDKPFRMTPWAGGTFRLYAAVVDTPARSYRFLLDSFSFTVSGHRPRVDSVRVVNARLHPGDKVAFRGYLSDADDDALTVIAATKKTDVWCDTFRLGPAGYSGVLTGKRPVTDTGTFVFTVVAADSTGLKSDPAADSFTVTANPPVVKFKPDVTVMGVAAGFPVTLNVTTANADSFAWTVDGGADTTTRDPKLTRVFITPAKATATVTVAGIDRYGYKGPRDTLRLIADTNYYDLTFTHVPGDSAFYGTAYWQVRTLKPSLVKDNKAKFFWTLLRLPAGDTVCSKADTGTGDSVSTLRVSDVAGLDSADLKVIVVLRDSQPKNSSQTLVDSSRIRRFRPKVEVLSVAPMPRPDTVCAGQKVTVRFRSSDPLGLIDSTFWKYADSPSVHRLAPSTDTLAFTWATPRTVTLRLWARDDDKQLSDTVRIALTVVKNAPEIVSLKRPPAAYTGVLCTLSVSVKKGVSNAPIKNIRWSITDIGDFASADTSKTVTFTSLGWKKIVVSATDAQGDSSARFTDSIKVISGKPAVRFLSKPDSVPARIRAVFKFEVVTPSGTIDTLYWKQADSAAAHAVPVKGGDSTFACSWAAARVVTIAAWIKDNSGNLSDTVTAVLKVTPGAPQVRGVSFAPTSNVFINDPLRFSIAASDTNGTVILYRIALTRSDGTDSVTARSDSAAVRLNAPSREGAYVIDAFVMDDDSLWSKAYRYPAPLVVRTGAPAILSFAPTTVWINDDTTFTCKLSDTNRTVTKAVFDWGDGKADTVASQSGTIAAKKHRYLSAGDFAVTVTAIDDDGLTAVFTATVTVKKGDPTILSFSPVTVWHNDDTTFRCFTFDTNGAIRKVVFAWGDGPADTVVAQPGQPAVKTHRYSSIAAATYQAKITAIDDDGLTAVLDTTITVKTGAPKLLSFYPATVWYNDDTTYSCSAFDTNGTIREIVFDWGTGSPDTVILFSGQTTEIQHRYTPPAGEGVFDARITAIDDDGLTAVLTTQITVKAGRPWTTELSPATVWINDDTTFHFTASDSNGTVRKVRIDWGDGKLDSATSSSNITDCNKRHQYTAAGVFNVRVAAVDDDGQTGTRSTPITVKKGAPVVRAVRDTFVIYSTKGFGKGLKIGDSLYCKDTAYDTNGTIKRYVWIFSPPFDTTGPDTVGSSENEIRIHPFHTYFNSSARFFSDSTFSAATYVRDDDRITSFDTFHLYYDGPRNCSTSCNCVIGESGDSARFEWNNASGRTDSIEVLAEKLQKSDSVYPAIRLFLVVDSTYNGYLNKPNDTISVNGFNEFVPIASRMRYDDARKAWRCAFRPDSLDFAKYKSGLTGFVYFHAVFVLRTRSGVIQTWNCVTPRSPSGGLYTKLEGMRTDRGPRSR